MHNNILNSIKTIEDFGILTANPKVSVIIVTCNRSRELVECLDGLEKQTKKDFEIIVADNGYFNPSNYKNRNLKYIQLKSNFFPSFARNVCLKFARGEIVAFLDDDAIPDRNWVKNILISFKNNNIIALRGKILPKNSMNIFNIMAGHYNLGNAIIPSFIDVEGNCAFNKYNLLEVNGFKPDIFGFEGIELNNRLTGDKDIHLSIYDPSVVIFHDACNSFIYSQLKNIRHAKNLTILMKQNPELSKFIQKYLDLRTNYFEGLNLNLLSKIKILLLKIVGILTYKLGFFIGLFSYKHK